MFFIPPNWWEDKNRYAALMLLSTGTDSWTIQKQPSQENDDLLGKLQDNRFFIDIEKFCDIFTFQTINGLSIDTLNDLTVLDVPMGRALAKDLGGKWKHATW